MSKELGKITSAKFGFGGYQDAMIGLRLSFESGFWSVNHFISLGWASTSTGGNLKEICSLLEKAKVSSVDKLAGIPVELEFDGMTFKSFRVLEEVL